MQQPQTATVRRRRRHNQARRTILDAAQQLLLDEGIEGFTMRKLARRCGYTAPTIYHYFGDKQGLLDTLLERLSNQLLTELEAVPPREDPLAVLRDHFHAIVRFGTENPKHYRLLLSARSPDADPLPSNEAARAMLEAPLEQIFSEGRVRAADIEPVRQALWSLMHGLISLQNGRPDVEWAPELSELALEALLEGLLQPAAAMREEARA